MRVLVTGSGGFIGKNLIVALSRREGTEVMQADLDTPWSDVRAYLADADAVFHLAGVNRPECDDDFVKGNVESTRRLLQGLEELKRAPLIVLSSSTQAELGNAYGDSKRLAENLLLEHATRASGRVRIFRLPGVFGKWCRPNYNSVVATFCHNIARGLPITVSDPALEVELVHVDTVIGAFVKLLESTDASAGAAYCQIEPVYRVSLGRLAAAIQTFQELRSTQELPSLGDDLIRLLYSTYLSYLDENDLAYGLRRRADARGELAELLRSRHLGQLFVSRTRPGITRGNHYHDAKVEKFVVVEGEALIRLRSILGGDLVEYRVTGQDFRVVDIPPGNTHNITNVGQRDLVVLFWASEPFDPARPDTYGREV